MLQSSRPSSSSGDNLFEPSRLFNTTTPSKNIIATKTGNSSSHFKKHSLPRAKTRSGKKDKKKSVASNDVWICPVCSVAYLEGAVDMIGCDGCNNWFHFICVNMLKPPPPTENWFCPTCCKNGKSRRR